MKKLIIIITLSFFSTLTFADSAQNGLKNTLITKISPYSVNDTMDKFESLIKRMHKMQE